ERVGLGGQGVWLDGPVASLHRGARHTPAAFQARLHVGDVFVEVAADIAQAADESAPVGFGLVGLARIEATPEEGVAVERSLVGTPDRPVEIGLEGGAEHGGVDLLLAAELVDRDRVEFGQHLLPVLAATCPAVRAGRRQAAGGLPAPVDPLAGELFLAPVP